MFFIVGLGNPGSEYDWSRHNLGFLVIDKLAEQERIAVTKRECRSLVGRGEIESQPVKLVKPQTYMNLSGEAVGCLLRKHNLVESGNRHVIVISDDLALPFGKIRIREHGSAGGHNGLKSIIATLGNNEFIRLRIGIQPDHPLEDTRGFVLNVFPRSERKAVEEVLETSAEAIRTIFRDGVLKAMAKHN